MNKISNEQCLCLLWSKKPMAHCMECGHCSPVWVGVERGSSLKTAAESWRNTDRNSVIWARAWRGLGKGPMFAVGPHGLQGSEMWVAGWLRTEGKRSLLQNELRILFNFLAFSSFSLLGFLFYCIFFCLCYFILSLF